MQRLLKYILIIFVSGTIGCTSETEKYHQTLDVLNAFELAKYKSLHDGERSEYLRNTFTNYHLQVTDVIVDWQLPFAAGEINEKLYVEVIGLSENKPIVFFSGGGEELYSDKIANFIIDRKIDLIIPHICASACAEDILPAADKLYFLDEPIIAYHGAAQNAQFHLASGSHSDPCPSPLSKTKLLEEYQHTVDKKIERYRKTGHNTKFWKEQEKRLKNFSFNVEIKKGNFCARGPSYANATYWLPTSKELKNLLGLKFEGKVCADDKNCYEKKLLLFYGPNKRFIINDEIFTT